MNWRDRIVCDPEILVGKPTIKGTRISVELILDFLASGWSLDDLLTNYPHIACRRSSRSLQTWCVTGVRGKW